MLKDIFGNKDFYINLINNNPLYVVWFLFYFIVSVALLGSSFGAFILTSILYVISLTIALSPLGEMILRFFEKVRPLYTKREQEYLIPLFEDVYDSAKEVVPDLPEIEICIIDTMAVNALALGRNTIAVTKGAVETFSEEELKAVIAHEIAHIINGDTIATLLTVIGNGIFTILVLASKIILRWIDSIQHPKSFGKLTTTIARMIFVACIFVFMFVGNFIVSINSRKSEHRADEFAYELEYGEELVEALYIIQQISLEDNSDTVARLTASHPHIAKRIGTIETLIDGES